MAMCHFHDGFKDVSLLWMILRSKVWWGRLSRDAHHRHLVSHWTIERRWCWLADNFGWILLPGILRPGPGLCTRLEWIGVSPFPLQVNNIPGIPKWQESTMNTATIVTLIATFEFLRFALLTTALWGIKLLNAPGQDVLPTEYHRTAPLALSHTNRTKEIFVHTRTDLCKI